MDKKQDNLPYQVRINNFLYNLQQQPYKHPSDDELLDIEEVEMTVNRIYMESVRPVIELIHMGRIDEAIETYTSLESLEQMEKVTAKVKKLY